MPASHLVLTWRDEVSVDLAVELWRKLVHVLNVGMCRQMGGKGREYRRWWKHSYFSYVMALERQKRGTLHVHALVDHWVDFEVVHRVWQQWAGWAWIRTVPPGDLVAMRYVLKYVTKVNQPSAVWLKRNRVKVPQMVNVRRVPVDEIVRAYLSEVP